VLHGRANRVAIILAGSTPPLGIPQTTSISGNKDLTTLDIDVESLTISALEIKISIILNISLNYKLL
jgi:hypothetical protein